MNSSTASSQSTNRLLGGIFAVLGLFILGAGGYYGWESLQLVQQGLSTTGAVVGFHEKISDEDQQVSYAPVIEYRVDGELFRFASADYANAPAYAVGAQLELLYDPERPDQARLDRFGSLWGLPLGIGFAGLLVTIVGFGIFRKKR